MKFMFKLLWVLAITLLNTSCTPINPANGPHPAVTHAIPLWQLEHYNQYDPRVAPLLAHAAALSREHLAYRFGGANPQSGGMDCSGVIYYLLRQAGVNDAPRQAYQMYRWTLKYGQIHRVNTRNLNDPAFSSLKPGDLLFWSGTYRGAPPISHVMLYLGKDRHGQRLAFGSDDGFPYQGKLMWGVSVYDFILPPAPSAGKFVGYSCIPHLTC